MTAPGCGMGDALKEDARAKVQGLAGVTDVDIEIVWEPPWDQSRMSEGALYYSSGCCEEEEMMSIEISPATTMVGRERGPQPNACALHLRVARSPSRAHAAQIGRTAHRNPQKDKR